MLNDAALYGLMALIWSGWQEVRMWKMCDACPFKRAAIAPEISTDMEKK